MLASNLKRPCERLSKAKVFLKLSKKTTMFARNIMKHIGVLKSPFCRSSPLCIPKVLRTPRPPLLGSCSVGTRSLGSQEWSGNFQLCVGSCFSSFWLNVGDFQTWFSVSKFQLDSVCTTVSGCFASQLGGVDRPPQRKMQTSSEGKVAFNCGPVKCNFCEFCINNVHRHGPENSEADRYGLQKRDGSSWNVAMQGWKNFGSEDIEWFLFCWHRNRCRLMRICLLLYAVFNIHPPDHGWHQPVVFFESTSRYRVLRDLHTLGHPNKSRSLGKIGKVACSVTPSACPLKCFVAISPSWDTSKG